MWSSAKTALLLTLALGGRLTKAKRFADDAQNFTALSRCTGRRVGNADDHAAAGLAGRFGGARGGFRHLPRAQPVRRRVRACARRLRRKTGRQQARESAINGMLAGLDPHSSYMDPK